MISVRYEENDTITFQFAETVVRGLPTDSWDEDDVRTVVSSLHNMIWSTNRRTRIGDVHPSKLFMDMDSRGCTLLGECTARSMMWELRNACGGDGIPYDAVYVIRNMSKIAVALGLEYAYFFQSRVFTTALLLRWMPHHTDLPRHWQASQTPEQFVRDVCYYMYLQFDENVRMITNRKHYLQVAQACDIAYDKYSQALEQSSRRPVNEAMVACMEGEGALTGDAASDNPYFDPCPEPWRGSAKRRMPHREAMLALLMRRRKLPPARIGTAGDMVERFNNLLRYLEDVIDMMDVVVGGVYARPGNTAYDKLAKIVLSLPYLVHTRCVNLLYNYLRRYEQLFLHFHYIPSRSMGGMCFFAQFLSETHMDMYLHDLLVHVEKTTTIHLDVDRVITEWFVTNSVLSKRPKTDASNESDELDELDG
jgi:hypothetical protein